MTQLESEITKARDPLDGFTQQHTLSWEPYNFLLSLRVESLANRYFAIRHSAAGHRDRVVVPSQLDAMWNGNVSNKGIETLRREVLKAEDAYKLDKSKIAIYCAADNVSVFTAEKVFEILKISRGYNMETALCERRFGNFIGGTRQNFKQQMWEIDKQDPLCLRCGSDFTGVESAAEVSRRVTGLILKLEERAIRMGARDVLLIGHSNELQILRAAMLWRNPGEHLRWGKLKHGSVIAMQYREETSFSIDVSGIESHSRLQPVSNFLKKEQRIDSAEQFNKVCRGIVQAWRGAASHDVAAPLLGQTVMSGPLMNYKSVQAQIHARHPNSIPTAWGGVFVTSHEHPHVQKYLAVNSGSYLALEKHEQKSEKLTVVSGAGVLLYRPYGTEALLTKFLEPGTTAEFKPGEEHCVIALEDLLVFEESTDPKGMDKDLIFIYSPG